MAFTNEDLVAQQDDLRARRSFISFLSGALGVQDQTYAGQDGMAVNQPRQYQTIGLNGSVGVEGTSTNNTQVTASFSLPMLIMIAAGLFFVLKR